MERIYKIQRHPVFQEQFQLLQEAEKERIFCKHTMEHFLDVSRLMYIYNLEEGTGLSKELIYAAGLLHDIGRYEQIQFGTPHDQAGMRLAGEIMRECDFSEKEILRVKKAIGAHRQKDEMQEDPLAVYLYRADKKSRNCFSCAAAAECNWPDEKRNTKIEI